MDPAALEKAFELYPDVRLVVIAHLYGTPGKVDELKAVCEKHGALIVEDAAESFGATYKGVQTGMFGTESVISFNGNKIITGSAGGLFLTNSEEDADKVRKWSTQSREAAPWYQHEEIGYNYRMSNIIAGVVRGQIPYLDEHIAQKKTIYERYEKGLADLPIKMNPWDREKSVPNFWLSLDKSFPKDAQPKDFSLKSGRRRSSTPLSSLAYISSSSVCSDRMPSNSLFSPASSKGSSLDWAFLVRLSRLTEDTVSRN
jgi:dTDP-4-amino-4,6-dideoxygalactose transaminase